MFNAFSPFIDLDGLNIFLLSYQSISYMKCLADVFQLKIREGKTKRKSPRTFKIVLHISIRFQLVQSISFVLDEHSLYQIEIHFGHLRLHLFG